jgi:catechol 2,3-dioxygenase-like lactoylglutathione lyase family enzyme
VTRIHHVQITVPKGAEDRARAFYCGVLGLREVKKADALLSRGGFWMECGEAQVHIGVEDGVERAATKAHVAYQVDDLEAMRARLIAAGIAPIEGIPIPGMTRFEIRDPFGNRVELLQLATDSV